MKTVVLTVLVLVVVVVAGTLFIAYSGTINVAADHKDPAVVDWFLSTTSDHSVERRAEDIAVPDLSGDGMVAEGAGHYRRMCVGCHGAPGLEASPVAMGLNPEAPSLASQDAPAAAEEFWVVKHGIRMTGMPGFGTTHSDAEIWDIVAFLQRLKGMSAADYSTFVQRQSSTVPGDEEGGTAPRDSSGAQEQGTG